MILVSVYKFHWRNLYKIAINENCQKKLPTSEHMLKNTCSSFFFYKYGNLFMNGNQPSTLKDKKVV